MIKANDLARYVISQANYMGYHITHLKLQKILYYIQGIYLGENHTPLFEESIEAWPYGPVVPVVYYEYVPFGALNLKPDGSPRECEPNWSAQDKALVDRILIEKLPISASMLVGATHRETPWLRHKDEVGKGMRPVISNRSMQMFFAGE